MLGAIPINLKTIQIKMTDPIADYLTRLRNAIKGLKRASRPGLRQYTGYKNMPRVLNGLGIAILSTSKGVMTNKKASELKVGGEVLCYVY